MIDFKSLIISGACSVAIVIIRGIVATYGPLQRKISHMEVAQESGLEFWHYFNKREYVNGYAFLLKLYMSLTFWFSLFVVTSSTLGNAYFSELVLRDLFLFLFVLNISVLALKNFFVEERINFNLQMNKFLYSLSLCLCVVIFTILSEKISSPIMSAIFLVYGIGQIFCLCEIMKGSLNRESKADLTTLSLSSLYVFLILNDLDVTGELLIIGSFGLPLILDSAYDIWSYPRGVSLVNGNSKILLYASVILIVMTAGF